jgi:hypothetical protein
MSLNIINITVPKESILEDILHFSPEENFLMLQIGSKCILEGRKFVAGLTQQEIYNKIKEESKEVVKKLELDILVERETAKKMEEKITKIYDTQVLQMKKQIEVLSKQIMTYESGNKEFIDNEIKKANDKFELLLQEKDKQNKLNREVFDKASLLISKNVNKTSVSLGDVGENIIEYLSETFKDFTGYKIENKSKQGHKGDFHLFFEEFNVLVDSKNYSGSVQKKEVLKIESDLMINDNMKFAWMVSLNSPISDQNRFPITSKWITTDVGLKCILFINNLLATKEPANLLRQAWYICDEFNKITRNVYKENSELVNYKEKKLKQKKQIEKLQERVCEIKRSINTSYNILKNMDNDLLEMLTELSDEIISDKFNLSGKINDWWNNNIEYTNDESKITSTEIWSKFKKENKDYILENKITIEQFKDIITGVVDNSSYNETPKKTVIEFTGYTFKTKIENIVVETEIPSKIKKVLNRFYFTQEQDNKILNDYKDESNNIMTISSNNNVRPWEVVSLLMKHKIIKERKESRGYDIYIQSEEYKNNCNK